MRLSQEPENLTLRVRIATLLRDAGRATDAVALLRAAALAYRDQGNDDRAMEVGQAVLELTPDDAEIVAMVAELSAHDDEVTAVGRNAIREDLTLVDPRAPAARAAARARSASMAALISHPRVLTRPPPLRTPQRSNGMFHEDTPLPAALPYHIADPSTPASKAPYGVRGVRMESDPSKVTGLAEAARRISGLIIHTSENEASIPEPVRDDRAPFRAMPPVASGRDTASHPAVDRVVGEAADDRTAPTSTAAIEAASNTFFATLSESERDAALQRFERRRVQAGEIVIRQGALSHPLVAVLEGRLELRLERPNCTDTILDTIEIGYYVGEAALLGRAPAPANVIAVTDSELLLLSPSQLFELAGAYPSLWAALKDSAERRTRRYDQIIRALP